MPTPPPRLLGQPEDYSFRAPEDVFDANDRIEQIIRSTKTIEKQLSETRRTDPKTDKKLTAKQYVQWRQNALTAMRRMIAEQEYLKEWKRAYLLSLEGDMTGLDPRSCDDLLKGAFKLIKTVRVKYGMGDLPPDVRHVADLVEAYVLGVGDSEMIKTVRNDLPEEDPDGGWKVERINVAERLGMTPDDDKKMRPRIRKKP